MLQEMLQGFHRYVHKASRKSSMLTTTHYSISRPLIAWCQPGAFCVGYSSKGLHRLHRLPNTRWVLCTYGFAARSVVVSMASGSHVLQPPTGSLLPDVLGVKPVPPAQNSKPSSQGSWEQIESPLLLYGCVPCTWLT